MGLIEALVLGVLQGLTEFLPVSSSGHLVLLQHLFGWGELPQSVVLAFDTILHLGTLVAVVAVFWRDLLQLIAGWWQGLRRRRILATPESRLAWWIILGTVPAALAGLFLEEVFEGLFSAPRPVGAFLLLTAVLLLLAELLGRRRRELKEMTWLDGLLVGIAQAAAIAPGLSRSGATIATGMFKGVKRQAAARFSFLLSVPIIAGTGIVQLARLIVKGGGQAAIPRFFGAMAGAVIDTFVKEGGQALLPNLLDPGRIPALMSAVKESGQVSFLALLVGFLAAAVCGYAAIRLLLALVRRRPLYPFALYCAVLGLLALLAL